MNGNGDNGIGGGEADQGDIGEGYGGNGGYDNGLYGGAPTVAVGPTLQQQYDLNLAEIENEKLRAEAELEKSKKEFLEAQVGMGDPAKIGLAQMMPKVGGPNPWLLIGIGLFLVFRKKIFK